MSLNPVHTLLGRRLRLAVIGGGPGSFIGAMHRQAAALDNRYELVAAALSSNLDGYALTREIIRVYVETVAAEPEPYRFVMANNSASKSKAVAESEQINARMLAELLSAPS